jgi:hypothetical protein
MVSGSYLGAILNDLTLNSNSNRNTENIGEKEYESLYINSLYINYIIIYYKKRGVKSPFLA